MRRIHISSIAIFVAFLLSSCVSTNKSLSGTYQSEPFTFNTTMPISLAMESISEIFQSEGYKIGQADQANGILLTNALDLTKRTTIEKRGKLKDPTAHVVSTTKNYFMFPFEPDDVKGQWSATLVESNGLTSIAMSLENVSSQVYIKEIGNNILSAKSTGVFESKVSEMLREIEKDAPRIRKKKADEVVVSSNQKVNRKVEKATMPEKSKEQTVSAAVEVTNTPRVASFSKSKELEHTKQMSNDASHKSELVNRERADFETYKAKELNRLKAEADALEEKKRLFAQLQERKRSEATSNSEKNNLTRNEFDSNQDISQESTDEGLGSSTKSIRYIQFIATYPGKSFDELSHLGDIVTEPVPGRKNVQRYKLSGRWSDSEAAKVRRALVREGFTDAFESR